MVFSFAFFFFLSVLGLLVLLASEHLEFFNIFVRFESRFLVFFVVVEVLAGRLLLEEGVLLVELVVLGSLAFLVFKGEALVEFLQVLSDGVVVHSELILVFFVVVSAETALGVLVDLAHLDGSLLSIEADRDSLGKVDDGEVFRVVDVVLLEVFNFGDLLSVDLDDDLVVSGFHLDDGVLGDDLHLLVFGFLVDLLHHDGERLARAVLGDDGVAGSDGGLVDDFVEGLDSLSVDAAFGAAGVAHVLEEFADGVDFTGLFLAADQGEGLDGGGELDVGEADTLGGGLDGDVEVLAGAGVDDDGGEEVVVTSLDQLGGFGVPHVPDLQVFVDSGPEGFRFFGDLVGGEDVVLVDEGGSDFTAPFRSRALDPLLGDGTFSLELKLDLLGLVRSPFGFDGGDELVLLVGAHLVEFGDFADVFRGHDLGGSGHGPFLVFTGKRRAADFGVELAVAELRIADSGEFHLSLVLLASTDGLVSGLDGVLVHLAGLVLVADVLVQLLAAFGFGFEFIHGFVVIVVDGLELLGGFVEGFELRAHGDLFDGLEELAEDGEDDFLGGGGSGFVFNVDVVFSDLGDGKDVLVAEAGGLVHVSGDGPGGFAFGGEFDEAGFHLDVAEGLDLRFTVELGLGVVFADESQGEAVESEDAGLLLGEADDHLDLLGLFIFAVGGDHDFGFDGEVQLEEAEGFNSGVDDGGPEFHLLGVDSRDHGLSLEEDLDSFGFNLELEFSFDGGDDGHGVEHSEGHTRGGGDLHGAFVERSDGVESEGLSFEELPEGGEAGLLTTEEGLHGFGEGFLADGEDDLVDIADTDAEHSEGLGAAVFTAVLDLQVIEDGVEFFLSVVDRGTASGAENVLGGDSIDELLVVAFQVILGQAEFEVVLLEESVEERVQVESDLLGEHVVGGEDGFPVDEESFALFLGVDGDTVVAGSADFFFLDVGHLEDGLQVLSHLLFNFDGGLAEGLHGGVDEGLDVLATLVEEHVGDLVEDSLVGDGVHDHGESGHADFGLFLGVLEDGHQDALDLAGHLVAETAESVDGLLADDGGFTTVGDDLLEVEDSEVDGGVSEGLQGEDLFVFGFSAGELGDESLLVLLLLVAGALFFGFVDVVMDGFLAEFSDHGTGGEPAGLTEGSRALSDFGLAETEEGVDLLVRGGGESRELLEGLDGLSGGDLLVEDFFNELVDGVAGSGDGEGIGEHFFLLLLFRVGRGFLDLLADLLELFNGAHADDLDELLELHGGFDFDSVDLVGDGVGQLAEDLDDLFNLVVDLVEGAGFAGELFISVLEEALFELVPFGGVEEGFFLGLELADGSLGGLLLNGFEGQLTGDNGLHGLLGFGVEALVDVVREDLDTSDGVLFGGSDQLVAEDSGAFELLFFDFLLLGFNVGLFGTGSVADSGDLLALLEVNGLGDVEDFLLAAFRFFDLVDGVDGLAFSFKSDLKRFHIRTRRLIQITNLGKSEHAGLSGLVVVAELFDFESLDVGGTALQVKLNHVEDSALDVLGPGGVLLVEEDTLDESVDVIELQGHLELFEEFRFHLLLFEELHGLDTAGLNKISIERSDADIFEAKDGGAFGFEVELDVGGESVGGLLVDGVDAAESGGDLGVVAEGVFLSGTEGFSVAKVFFVLPELATSRGG